MKLLINRVEDEMGFIKTFWNILVIGFGLAYAGVLVKGTLIMGREAFFAQQQGLVSLGKLTHMLTTRVK
jgi:hypothetical protein